MVRCANRSNSSLSVSESSTPCVTHHFPNGLLHVPYKLWLAIVVLLAAAALSGCASPQWVTLRNVPRNPLGDELQLTSRSGPQPTPRTMQLLRVNNLTDALQGDSGTLLESLQHITEREPTADKVYAMSELAYLSARKIEKQDKAKALDLYGAAVLHAYSFLFDDRLAATRNCYDPQFRGACELYNGALESALRLGCDRGELRPGMTKIIHTAAGTWDINCVLRGGVWQPDDFEHFEFVSDYEMKGLKKPLSNPRAGRAADRRPPQLQERAGGGPLLPAGPEFPGHCLPAADRRAE